MCMNYLRRLARPQCFLFGASTPEPVVSGQNRFKSVRVSLFVTSILVHRRVRSDSDDLAGHDEVGKGCHAQRHRKSHQHLRAQGSLNAAHHHHRTKFSHIGMGEVVCVYSCKCVCVYSLSILSLYTLHRRGCVCILSIYSVMGDASATDTW